VQRGCDERSALGDMCDAWVSGGANSGSQWSEQSRLDKIRLTMEIDKLPTLTPQQRRLLDEIHAYWRKNRRFPKTVALSVPLRKEINVKAVLETMPRNIVSRDDGHSDAEVLKLQIVGLALCPGEEAIVEAFLEMLRRAAKRAISAPGSKPKVTSADLRDILKDMPQDEFELVSPIVKNGFGWGGSEMPATGEWSREPTFAVIRFENVRTIDEYLRLESIRPREKHVLEQAHVAVLRRVYGGWRRDGRWPGSREFIVAYRTTGDALRLLREIPNRFRNDGVWESFEGNQISLTLDGIASTGLAEDDLAAFVRLVKVLIRHFESSPEDAKITIAELARESKVSESAVERLAGVIAGEWGLGVELHRKEPQLIFKIRDPILDFEGIETFIEYVKRREDLARRRGMAGDGELDDRTIRRAILEVFAALPEDGSKHLNRSNILGRPYQAGDLEQHLNHTFTIEERGRADRLMRNLESEGLLVPTWRDIVAPADWLVITKEGRAALLEPPAAVSEPATASLAPERKFDAFLCHAKEDKAAVVTPFGKLMEKNGLKPWIDVKEIGWGDSLVKSIEHGLTQSRFVIVFISETSLKKKWTEKELRTALSMEVSGPKKVLPVILGIDHATLEKSNPFLAEKRYLTIRPYDAKKVVSDAELQGLLDALKAELAKPSRPAG